MIIAALQTGILASFFAAWFAFVWGIEVYVSSLVLWFLQGFVVSLIVRWVMGRMGVL